MLKYCQFNCPSLEIYLGEIHLFNVLERTRFSTTFNNVPAQYTKLMPFKKNSYCHENYFVQNVKTNFPNNIILLRNVKNVPKGIVYNEIEIICDCAILVTQ